MSIGELMQDDKLLRLINCLEVSSHAMSCCELASSPAAVVNSPVAAATMYVSQYNGVLTLVLLVLRSTS